MLGVEGTGSGWIWPEQRERAIVVLGETGPRKPDFPPVGLSEGLACLKLLGGDQASGVCKAAMWG